MVLCLILSEVGCAFPPVRGTHEFEVMYHTTVSGLGCFSPLSGVSTPPEDAPVSPFKGLPCRYELGNLEHTRDRSPDEQSYVFQFGVVMENDHVSPEMMPTSEYVGTAMDPLAELWIKDEEPFWVVSRVAWNHLRVKEFRVDIEWSQGSSWSSDFYVYYPPGLFHTSWDYRNIHMTKGPFRIEFNASALSGKAHEANSSLPLPWQVGPDLGWSIVLNETDPNWAPVRWRDSRGLLERLDTVRWSVFHPGCMKMRLDYRSTSGGYPNSTMRISMCVDNLDIWRYTYKTKVYPKAYSNVLIGYEPALLPRDAFGREAKELIIRLRGEEVSVDENPWMSSAYLVVEQAVFSLMEVHEGGHVSPESSVCGFATTGQASPSGRPLFANDPRFQVWPQDAEDTLMDCMNRFGTHQHGLRLYMYRPYLSDEHLVRGRSMDGYVLLWLALHVPSDLLRGDVALSGTNRQMTALWSTTPASLLHKVGECNGIASEVATRWGWRSIGYVVCEICKVFRSETLACHENRKPIARFKFPIGIPPDPRSRRYILRSFNRERRGVVLEWARLRGLKLSLCSGSLMGSSDSACTFDGSSSYDPDGYPVSFAWRSEWKLIDVDWQGAPYAESLGEMHLDAMEDGSYASAGQGAFGDARRKLRRDVVLEVSFTVSDVHCGSETASILVIATDRMPSPEEGFVLPLVPTGPGCTPDGMKRLVEGWGSIGIHERRSGICNGLKPLLPVGLKTSSQDSYVFNTPVHDFLSLINGGIDQDVGVARLDEPIALLFTIPPHFANVVEGTRFLYRDSFTCSTADHYGERYLGFPGSGLDSSLSLGCDLELYRLNHASDDVLHSSHEMTVLSDSCAPLGEDYGTTDEVIRLLRFAGLVAGHCSAGAQQYLGPGPRFFHGTEPSLRDPDFPHAGFPWDPFSWARSVGLRPLGAALFYRPPMGRGGGGPQHFHFHVDILNPYGGDQYSRSIDVHLGSGVLLEPCERTVDGTHVAFLHPSKLECLPISEKPLPVAKIHGEGRGESGAPTGSRARCLVFHDAGSGSPKSSCLLSGRNSSDPLGFHPLSYSWRMVSAAWANGTTIEHAPWNATACEDPGSSTCQLLPPEDGAVLLVELVVTDRLGVRSLPATVEVRATSRYPACGLGRAWTASSRMLEFSFDRDVPTVAHPIAEYRPGQEPVDDGKYVFLEMDPLNLPASDPAWFVDQSALSVRILSSTACLGRRMHGSGGSGRNITDHSGACPQEVLRGLGMELWAALNLRSGRWNAEVVGRGSPKLEYISGAVSSAAEFEGRHDVIFVRLVVDLYLSAAGTATTKPITEECSFSYTPDQCKGAVPGAPDWQCPNANVPVSVIKGEEIWCLGLPSRSQGSTGRVACVIDVSGSTDADNDLGLKGESLFSEPQPDQSAPWPAWSWSWDRLDATSPIGQKGFVVWVDPGRLSAVQARAPLVLTSTVVDSDGHVSPKSLPSRLFLATQANGAPGKRYVSLPPRVFTGLYAKAPSGGGVVAAPLVDVPEIYTGNQVYLISEWGLGLDGRRRFPKVWASPLWASGAEHRVYTRSIVVCASKEKGSPIVHQPEFGSGSGCDADNPLVSTRLELLVDSVTQEDAYDGVPASAISGRSWSVDVLDSSGGNVRSAVKVMFGAISSENQVVYVDVRVNVVHKDPDGGSSIYRFATIIPYTQPSCSGYSYFNETSMGCYVLPGLYSDLALTLFLVGFTTLLGLSGLCITLFFQKLCRFY